MAGIAHRRYPDVITRELPGDRSRRAGPFIEVGAREDVIVLRKVHENVGPVLKDPCHTPVMVATTAGGVFVAAGGAFVVAGAVVSSLPPQPVNISELPLRISARHELRTIIVFFI